MKVNFKNPLSIDEISNKLVSIKEIFLKMLENNDDFQRWVSEKKLDNSKMLQQKLKQHGEKQGNKEEVIFAINSFNKNDLSSVERLNQILMKDGQLHKLIVENEQCFINTLKKWQTRTTTTNKTSFASTSNAQLQRKNQFFDEDPSTAIDLFAMALPTTSKSSTVTDTAEKENVSIADIFKM